MVPGVLTLGARVFTADLSLRADDVEITLEPQITGGFLLVLTQGIFNYKISSEIPMTAVRTEATNKIVALSLTELGPFYLILFLTLLIKLNV